MVLLSHQYSLNIQLFLTLYHSQKMEDKIKVNGSDHLTEKTSLLMNDNSQNEDIRPQELSGDENAEKSILIESNAFSQKKASIKIIYEGVLFSVTILMKAIIGVGILSLPFIFSTMGIIPTFVMFVLAGMLTHFTAILLLRSKNLSGHSNYSSIMYHLHHHKAFKIIVSLTMMSGNFGACILDLMFFKTTVRKILGDIITNQQVLDQFYTSQYMILIIMAFVQFPITLLNKIQKLKMFSFLGVSGIFIFIIAFLIYYSIQMSNGVPLRNMELFPDDWYKAIATVPNIIFSLTFQTNFFPIFKGLESSSDNRMIKVVLIGIWTCISMYFLLGFLGFSITEKKNIAPNFLEEVSYESTNGILFAVMNGGFLVSLFFAFSVIFFSCRNNFILIIKLLIEKKDSSGKRWREEHNSIEQISDYVAQPNIKAKRRRVKMLYIVYTFINFIAIVLIAMFVSNIESVFNLVGSISCSAISILFPLYYYIKLTHIKKKQKRTIYYIAIALLSLMVPFCIFSVVALYI